MSFKFYHHSKTKPKRVVILGTSGIISSNLQKALKKSKINVLLLGRSKLNLKKENAGKVLASKIKNKDVVIFIAAEAPVKNIKMFINNLKICNAVCYSLGKKNINHLIYISSDAVYADVKVKISEKTLTLPNSLHGLMHLTREIILKNRFNKILCILRPTLIYGPGDSHNGYGPNRFLNFALRNKSISIFGNGEEKRDHIFIQDLIKIIVKCIEMKGLGNINLVSGKIYSFRYLAKLVINLAKSKSKLVKIKRAGPMPHNGYRPFNITLLKKYFKEIKISTIRTGIEKYLTHFKKNDN